MKRKITKLYQTSDDTFVFRRFNKHLASFNRTVSTTFSDQKEVLAIARKLVEIQSSQVESINSISELTKFAHFLTASENTLKIFFADFYRKVGLLNSLVAKIENDLKTCENRIENLPLAKKMIAIKKLHESRKDFMQAQRDYRKKLLTRILGQFLQPMIYEHLQILKNKCVEKGKIFFIILAKKYRNILTNGIVIANLSLSYILQIKSVSGSLAQFLLNESFNSLQYFAPPFEENILAGINELKLLTFFSVEEFKCFFKYELAIIVGLEKLTDDLLFSGGLLWSHYLLLKRHHGVEAKENKLMGSSRPLTTLWQPVPADIKGGENKSCCQSTELRIT